MGYLVSARSSSIASSRACTSPARVPGSLAVATVVTCAIFATATGIVCAVVTLMGCSLFHCDAQGGLQRQGVAGAVTAGGCLGIPDSASVMLIVYGAVAGVSVVQLYAGAFFPGFRLAGLYSATSSCSRNGRRS